MRMRGCAAALAAVTLTVGLAGCSASYLAGTTAAHLRDLGPAAGSRPMALASARHLLDALVMPAGSRPLPARPVPPGLDQPMLMIGDGPDWVDLQRLYRLPLTMTAAAAALLASLPPGTSGGGSGQWTAGPVSGMDVSAELVRVPAGIVSVALVETIVPGPGSSALVRADAEVLWYPPRSAAEYLVAQRFRSVRISGSRSPTDVVTGGQRFIRPLAALLDSLPAAPPGVHSCPAISQTYNLAFVPALPHKPLLEVRLGGCGSDNVSVGARQQPALDDSGVVRSLMLRLLRSARREFAAGGKGPATTLGR